MILFPKISRYILRQCLMGLGLVLAIFVLAIMLVDVVEQMRTVGGDVELSVGQAVQLSAMKLPMLIEQTLPFAILTAAMIAFTQLNRRGELSIIRASGMSAWRFLTPLVAMAAVLGVASMTLLNPLGAYLTANFEATRAQLLQDGAPGRAAATMGGDIWLRQGNQQRQIVIYAEEVVGGSELRGVKLLEEERVVVNGQPTSMFEFVRRIDAERALIRDGFWQLENLVENTPGSAGVARDFLSIPTDLDADRLLDRFASPNTIGFWDLPRFISQTASAGLDASRYRMRYWSLLASPVLLVSMALIGALVCLRLSRLGGTSRLIAIGAGCAVGLFFITQLSSSLGSAGAAPAWIAAWSPALFALFSSLGVIAYREDG
ncbi:MAG: LptF/LptG family permease [Pseudomonadota bacterium]